MYPTTSYTRPISHSKLECNKYNTNQIRFGKERAILIAEQRIAYLFEIGHADTARALKERVDARTP